MPLKTFSYVRVGTFDGSLATAFKYCLLWSKFIVFNNGFIDGKSGVHN